MAMNNYTLGRGSLFFQPFAAGTQNPAGGERFFGDCNTVNITFKSTDLDHYSSTAGTKELDASVVLQVDRTGSITTENISPENLAAFFMGSSNLTTVAGAAVAAEAIAGVQPDRYFQLGISAANPGGARSLDPATPVVVHNGGVAAALGADYTVDYSSGAIYIVPGGGIAVNANITVDYKTLSGKGDHIVSGNSAAEGALRFRSANPAGSNRDAFLPWTRISPNGAFDLIGDKFTALQFDLKVLKKGGTGGEALYLDGRPV